MISVNRKDDEIAALSPNVLKPIILLFVVPSSVGQHFNVDGEQYLKRQSVVLTEFQICMQLKKSPVTQEVV